MNGIRDALVELVTAEHPMTVRQVFYRAVSGGIVEKSEAEYKGTIGRLLCELRRDGQIPFDWIADNTRWMRKPKTYDSKEQMLQVTAEAYRRAIWNDQDAYVEVWLEKEALAGVIVGITAQWDVPLMVTRGYPSLSYIHSAAEAISEQDKPAYLYYFGDHDPSGVDIPRTVDEGLRELAPDADIEFMRVAVNPEQIEELDLPTRPTKKTDSRSKGFEGDSVEVDAIPPAVLRKMVEACILEHIDADQLEATKAVEREERRTLHMMCGDWEAEEDE
jgi:hypothetical protein